MLTLTTQEILTNADLQRGMCLHCPKTGELALYSIVYRCIVYHRGRVLGHDGGYERGNMASRVAR